MQAGGGSSPLLGTKAGTHGTEMQFIIVHHAFFYNFILLRGICHLV